MSLASGLASAGLSMLSGRKGSATAERQARDAQRTQQALIDRQTGLFDAQLDNVRAMDRAGAFDPTGRIADLSKSLSYQSGVDRANAATAARTLGYRQGDTTPITQQRDLSQRAALDFAQLADGIRRQASQDRLTAYGSLSGSGLNAGIGAASAGLTAARRMDPGAGAFLGPLAATLANSDLFPYAFGKRRGIG